MRYHGFMFVYHCLSCMPFVPIPTTDRPVDSPNTAVETDNNGTTSLYGHHIYKIRFIFKHIAQRYPHNISV